jgi:N-acetylneuraminate synthase
MCQNVILQCTSEYPCPPERVGLNVIDEMRARYDLPVGFSDHTLTHEAAFIAVSKGISILEKHLTFSRAMYGSDAKHSLEPSEFKELVRGVRSIETMMRSPVDMHDVSRYEDMKQTFQKSIVSVADIPKGTVITRAMLGFKKPGTGIPGHCLAEIVGRKAAKNISKDAILKMEDLA